VPRGCSLNSHEHYEELCALAASGQVSPDLADLKAHLESCPSCRGLADDFAQVSAQGLSMLAVKRSQCQTPSGMAQRFVARARSEGIEMSRRTAAERTRHNRISVLAAMGAVAAVVLIVGILTIRKIHHSYSVANRAQPPAQQASVTPMAVPSPTSSVQDAESQQQLTAARKEMSSLAATIRAQRDELEALGKVKESLNSRLLEADQQNATFRSEKGEWQTRTSQLQADLEKARSDKGRIDVALTLQETELRELRKKVDEQADLLRQQDELTARGSDVRDLVVARNLHIIDVHDRDGDGKSQRAFGRIFYTEGKSLIFYAYDLGDPRKVDARVSFYVWGGLLGTEKPIENLGVFHNDDASDGRWVLTFDDPHVLAQINSVFVTVESSRKAVREPGGRRILFAFLGEKPNHP
jgi:hypothetical protein